MSKKSIADIVRERNQAAFIGREEQIRQFEENLELPEDDERRRFIINITGQGGVGKTWLGNQFIQRMREKKAVTAKIDRDVKNVVDALGQLAEQLQTQGHKLKQFDERYKAYLQKKQELEADPDAPDGLVDVVGRWGVKSAFTAIKTIPGANLATDLLDQSAIETGVSKGLQFLMKKITNKDEQELLLHPTKVLTPLFLDDLSGFDHTVGLWIDTYEQTCSLLDEWLRQIYHGDLGEAPLNLLVIISGRDQLDKNDWADYQSILLYFPLEPFNEQEARSYLTKREIKEEKEIQVIVRLSMRLPILLDMLSRQRKNSQGEIEDVCDNAIERFLRWVDDLAMRDLALNAALPRFINQDIVAQLISPEKAASMFEWLCTQPFVEKHGDHWLYHDLVRDLMLRYKRQRSPDGWSKVHETLAGYYEQKRDALGLDEKTGGYNSEWQEFSLEMVYHYVCQFPTKNMAAALAGFISSLMISNDLDLRWAKVIQKAEQDCEIAGKNAWGIDLMEGVEAYYQERNFDKNIHMLERLLEYAYWNNSQKASLFYWLGIGNHLSENYPQAIANKTRAIELDPQNALYFDSRSISYHASEDYPRAIVDTTRAIELDPQNAEYYYSRGASYHASKDYPQAIADKSRAIELDPQNAEYYYSRGVSYRVSGDYAQAIADTTRAIELDQQNARYFEQRGGSYYASGDYAQAIANTTRAIELDPQNARYYQSRGASYHASGDYPQAIADKSSAIELDPQNARYYQSRGVSYHASGDYAQAIVDKSSAIELDPQNARYYQSRGASYHESGDYQRAIADKTRATELNPQNALYFDSRSTSYHASGDYPRAIVDTTRAIELDPQNAEYYYSRGTSYHMSGEYSSSIADMTRAIELDSQNARYFEQRGGSYYASGDYAQAIADTTRAIELDPQNARYFEQRGGSYYASGDYAQAIADTTRAIKLDPQNARYYRSRGASYLAFGDYPQAIADVTRAIELDPQNARYFEQRGASYYQTGDYAQAIADTTRAIELDPQNAEYYQSRGASYHASGDYPRAIADKSSAIELDPQNGRYFDSRSISYHVSGDYVQAIADTTRAIELDPQNAEYYQSRGASYHASGDYAQAIADATRAIELNPQNGRYYQLRGVSYYALGDYPRVIADMTRAIELNPEKSSAYSTRGRSYRRTEIFDLAVADHQKAIELSPKNDWHQYQFALLFIKQGQIDQAKPYLSAAIQMANAKLHEPIQDFDNTFNLALYYLACGEEMEALKRYTGLVQNPQTAGFIGQAIRDLQELEEVFADGRAQEVIARIQAQHGDKSS